MKRDLAFVGSIAALFAVATLAIVARAQFPPHGATNSTPLDWKPEEPGTNIFTRDPRPLVWASNSIEVFSWDTNNLLRIYGRIAGHVSGTNFFPIPDIHGLQTSFDEGFALGTRYGALAGRRNPDVGDASALLSIARALMQAEQARAVRLQQQPPPLPPNR